MHVSRLDMFFLRHLDGHQVHIAVPDASLGDDPVGAGAHLVDPALQNDGFPAIVMVQVNVLGRDSDVMMVVLDLRQAIRQLALVVVKHITDRRHAPGGLARRQLRLAQRLAHQVAKCLGPV